MMISRRIQTASMGILAALACVAADSGGATVHVGGSVATPMDLTVAQMQQQFAADIKAVTYNSKGQPHVFQCVPLLTVLKAAGVDTNFKMMGGAAPKVKNPQMRLVVVVSGRDGYTVAFSMAELLPMVGDRTAWVALTEDGEALSANDGPVRLIVPQDGMPSRGVHEVAGITVVDAGDFGELSRAVAATQP